jgi:hypothetical protein
VLALLVRAQPQVLKSEGVAGLRRASSSSGRQNSQPRRPAQAASSNKGSSSQ